ncbi:MAG TPA: hypothetical protein VMT34_05100, partial [Aggregatilineales bacterium]|nr:hypothetical protein [Aggregatilineales bacterium]
MTAVDLPQGMTTNTISLLLGHPDPSTLMTPEMQEAIQSMLASQSYRALQYGPEQGTQGLINFLVEKLNREQGMSIGPRHVMIVAGSTHAVDMITRLYAKPSG